LVSLKPRGMEQCKWHTQRRDLIPSSSQCDTLVIASSPHHDVRWRHLSAPHWPPITHYKHYSYTSFTRDSILREANMKQTYSKYTCMTCALNLLHACFMYVWFYQACLMTVLHVCFMFASSCKRGITETYFNSITYIVRRCLLHKLSVPKNCQCYFLNNSVKHCPIFIIFGRRHNEENVNDYSFIHLS